jgi:hypothetical protein
MAGDENRDGLPRDTNNAKQPLNNDVNGYFKASDSEQDNEEPQQEQSDNQKAPQDQEPQDKDVQQDDAHDKDVPQDQEEQYDDEPQQDEPQDGELHDEQTQEDEHPDNQEAPQDQESPDEDAQQDDAHDKDVSQDQEEQYDDDRQQDEPQDGELHDEQTQEDEHPDNQEAPQDQESHDKDVPQDQEEPYDDDRQQGESPDEDAQQDDEQGKDVPQDQEEPYDDDRQQGESQDEDASQDQKEQYDDEPQQDEPQGDEPQQDKPQKSTPSQQLAALDEVREYDADELKREIEGEEFVKPGKKTNEQVLNEIKEERKRLEEERAKLEKEKQRRMRKVKAEKERKRKEEEKKEDEEAKEEEKKALKPEVKSFAKERRKRKDLERMQTYLFGGEWALLIILVLAQLAAEGISARPLRIPFENTFYILLIFFLVIKIERFIFKFLNMKYSGTVYRKVTGVDLFRGLEWPTVIGWAFVTLILVLPPTHEFITTLVKVFTNDGAIYKVSSHFLLILTLLFLAHLVTGVIWIVYLTWYKKNVIVPELKKVEEPFKIEEVFLITNSGLLIKRVSRSKDSDMDDDILSSMLTAVKEFVKDSFSTSSEEGELDELQYGKMRIIIEYGRELYMAVLIKGQETRELRPQIKKMLRFIHRKYTKGFDTWDGDLAQFKGCENVLRNLLKLR